MTEEEFYQEAPQEISRPHLTKNDTHQLTLARLDWELEQRKRYVNLCKALHISNMLQSKNNHNHNHNLLKVSPWTQVGRKVQGVAGHKGEDPEEYRGEKGTSCQFAAWTQCHHAGTTTT